MAGETDLERQVFGGSDSELSEEEDNVQRKEASNEVQQDYQSSGDATEDEYQGSRPKKARRTRAKKSEDGPGEGKTAKKRKRKAPEEVNLEDLTPREAARYQLDQQIDAALKSGRSRPRKKKANEEVLDSFADEEVARLREAMNQAANDDIAANENKQPAVAKLKMLPEAMQTLRKASLAQSIIDNNLLEAVKRWLEPLPDTSLPALNIQREFFPMLRKMEFIDASVLKESRLGPVIMFYTKCKRVTPDIKRLADELVSVWSRPIIKRSASYRDRIIPTAGLSESISGVGQRPGTKLSVIMARAKEEDKNKVKRNVVSIPQRTLGDFTVAPRSNTLRANASIDSDIARRRNNDARMRALTRRVQGNKGG